MKKGIVTLFILFLVSGLYAQEDCMNSKSVDWEWAPIGAVWMYKTTGSGEYWYIQSEKDTVFHEKECRKLKVERYLWDGTLNLEHRYTYEKEGRVYLYSPSQMEFQVIYDFDVKANDTITLYSPLATELCYAEYVIDSVVTRLAGGWPNGYPMIMTNTKIESYHLSVINTMGCGDFSGNNYIGDYVSQSGATNSDLAPVFSGLVPELQETFCCYFDGSVNVAKPNIDSCISYYNTHNLGFNNNTTNYEIDVYPSVVVDEITIKTERSKSHWNVDVYNSEGMIVLKFLCEDEKIINLKALSPGMYLLLIYNKDKQYKEKILKL